MCLVPGGHKKVLEAMLHYQIFASERTRFQGTVFFHKEVIMKELSHFEYAFQAFLWIHSNQKQKRIFEITQGKLEIIVCGEVYSPICLVRLSELLPTYLKYAFLA